MSTSDLVWLGSMFAVTTGAAVILSILGISYAASVDQRKPWQALLEKFSSLFGLTMGTVFLWCGLIAGDFSFYQKILWGMVALLMISILVYKYRAARKEKHTLEPEGQKHA